MKFLIPLMECRSYTLERAIDFIANTIKRIMVIAYNIRGLIRFLSSKKYPVAYNDGNITSGWKNVSITIASINPPANTGFDFVNSLLPAMARITTKNAIPCGNSEMIQKKESDVKRIFNNRITNAR